MNRKKLLWKVKSENPFSFSREKREREERKEKE
jgi:hypothetical protein